MNDFAQALAEIRGRIEMATTLAGRPPHSVKLIAVSKTFGAEAVAEAARCGQRDFGENYVSEAIDKMRQLDDPQLIWHFIGPLQSNKTRQVAENFAWVHSVDRIKIAQRLSEQRPQTMEPLQILVQVNISGEASKGGVAPEAAAELCSAISELPQLQLRGLMAIPSAKAADPGIEHRRLEALRQQLLTDHPQLDCLSTGMSGDFEAAIAAGATHVRIGSALFGARSSTGA